MKTIALALAATTLASAPASAGVYFNTELNQGYEGKEYFGRDIDFHIGAEGVDGTETEVSGKAGINYNATDKVALYGEFSGITAGDFDNVYNVKAGAKFKF